MKKHTFLILLITITNLLLIANAFAQSKYIDYQFYLDSKVLSSNQIKKLSVHQQSKPFISQTVTVDYNSSGQLEQISSNSKGSSKKDTLVTTFYYERDTLRKKMTKGNRGLLFHLSEKYDYNYLNGLLDTIHILSFNDKEITKKVYSYNHLKEIETIEITTSNKIYGYKQRKEFYSKNNTLDSIRYADGDLELYTYHKNTITIETYLKKGVQPYRVVKEIYDEHQHIQKITVFTDLSKKIKKNDSLQNLAEKKYFEIDIKYNRFGLPKKVSSTYKDYETKQKNLGKGFLLKYKFHK